MCDGIMLMIGDDGVAHEYDDTYDIVIHCESQEDQDKVREKFMRINWTPCDERLPEENLPVLVAVKQKDRLPKWVKEQTYSYVTDIDVYDDGDFDTHKNKVVAWMPLPEPYRKDEEKGEAE